MHSFLASFGGLWAVACRFALLAACAVASVALALLGIAYPAGGGLVLAYAAWKRLRRWRGSGWLHGTARLSTFLDLYRNGLLGKSGLVVGRASFTAKPTKGQALGMLCSPLVPSTAAVGMMMAAFYRSGGDRLVRIRDYVHLAVFASTGAGKGRGFVIPILLSHFDSCIVIDPKGENYRLTAEHRRRNGHAILLLDPFHICGKGSDALNDLDMIDDTAPDFLEQVGDLAEALVIVTGQEAQPHFPESAKIVLKSIIAFVCAAEPDPAYRNMQSVRAILQSPERFQAAISAMQKITTHGGLISGMGHQLTWYVGKELNGILTTLHRFTSFLDSPAMAAITKTSTFDPRKFKTCKATLYLVLPPERLESLSQVNRMWISTLMRAISRGGASEKKEVLFLLDEAAQLGRMKILESAVSVMRGYGIRLFFFFQSVGQVTKLYGDGAAAFLDNIGTQIYFGVNAWESAEAISKRCGDATELVESLNTSDSFSRPKGGYSKDSHGSISISRSLNTSEMGRPLFRPDEVLRLSDEVGLLFHLNMFVTPLKLLRYYQEPEFMHGRCGQSLPAAPLRAGVVAVTALLFSLVGLAMAASLGGKQAEWRLFKPDEPMIPPDFYPPISGTGGASPPPARTALPNPSGVDTDPPPLGLVPIPYDNRRNQPLPGRQQTTRSPFRPLTRPQGNGGNDPYWKRGNFN